eukprot:TRINITY_DN685_c0_g1_i1.p1 TRINITY_DN685_c0_g1~~TRINITY_DN685_c0_g1_i1.p1  ORF type:complete len:547 (-),score=158.91 TRINITY_DN685_c0_g1_i1:271-1911(-)
MAGTMNNSGGGRNNGPRSGTSTKQRQGGANNHVGAKPNTQFSADQRKLLQKIRAVIPKDRASDEELMTMLVDQNMDTDRVVQQFFEAGNTESEWASVTSKSDKRKKKTELQTDTKPTARPTQPVNGQPGQPQRQPAAQRQAQPNRAPAQQTAAPAHRAPADGNSWAARLRGPQAAAPAPPEPRAPQPLPMPQDNVMNGAPMNTAPQQSQSPASMLQFGSFESNFGMAPEPQFPPPQQGFMPPAAAQKEGPFPEATVTSTTGRHGDVLVSNTQQNNIWTSLINLWDKRELCDLKLKPEPGETRISVHSVVIAAASSTVSQALINSRRESNSNVTPPELLVHCDCAALEECVRFCYTGELRVSDEAIQNLWYAASVLELREVLDLCVSWAQQHIHAGNALLINTLADQYQIPDLKAAVDRFVLNNVQSLVQEADFLSQPIERITELLSSDDAKFDCELEVFDAVVRWIEHDKVGRTGHLAHLMNTVVRLPQLDFDELEKVELNDLVGSDAKAKSLMHDVYRYLAAPTQRRLAMDIPGTRPRTNKLSSH